MFGESSMNSGASDTRLIVRSNLVQSSSRIVPLRMLFSGTCDSAESILMEISLRLISNEKITDVNPFLIDAARAKSKPKVELCVGMNEWDAKIGRASCRERVAQRG